MNLILVITTTFSLAAVPSIDALERVAGNGPCRGIGGALDKVNNRHAYEIDFDECKAYCEAEPNCKGMSHSAAINEGDCVLHGPDLDGTCSDPQYTREISCEEGGGVWAAPPEPWTGESWHSTVVARSTEESSSSYSCWEFDTEDHLAHCKGDNCSFTAANRTVSAPFLNRFLVMLDTAPRAKLKIRTSFDTLHFFIQKAENCPSGCAFTPAPEMPPAKPPHPGDVKLPGWPKPLSGACRGGPEGTDKVNGIYANKDSQTQQQCAEKCLSLSPNCTGYHHGAYCSVFGPGVHLAADDAVWFATAGNYTKITGTKVNPGYICFTSVPTMTDESTSRSTVFFQKGAMIVTFGAVIFMF